MAGRQEYDTQPGALVFIPAQTWISLKNTGKENISLMSMWNEPCFEKMLRCGSVPQGKVSAVISATLSRFRSRSRLGILPLTMGDIPACDGISW